MGFEAGESVRVEERRYRNPRFKDIDGQIGRVVDLREREDEPGGREALVEINDVFIKGRRGWIPVGYVRHYEPSVNPDSFLADS